MGGKVVDGLAAPHLSLAAATATAIACAATLLYVAMFLDAGPDHTLLGLANLSSVAICTLPFWLQRDRDIFQPMGYILVLTIIAMPLRHAYLMLTSPQAAEVLKLTNGKPITFFLPAALMINVALLSLVCGYLGTTYRFKIERIALFRSGSWRSAWYWPVTLMLVGISAGAFVKYVSLTGFRFDDVTDLSGKRTLYGSVPAGYLKWAAQLAQYPLLVTISYFLTRHRSPNVIEWLVFIVMAIVTMMLPFFLSIRSEIINLAIVGVAVYVYMGGKVSLTRMAFLILPIYPVISIITLFRGPRAEWTGFGDVFDPISFLASIAGAFNFGGFIATAHVMDAVKPEDYTFGSTLIYWAYGWIPRSIWTEKPREVGYLLLEILDFRGDVTTRRGGGAAAGLPAELYLNFGPYLVPLCMAIYGAVIRVVYNTLRPAARTAPIAAVLCAMLSFDLTYGSYGFSLTRGLLFAARDIISIWLVFILVLRYDSR